MSAMRERIKSLLAAARGNQLLWQIIRFGIVGGTAAVIDWCVLALCVRVLGLDSILSNVIAFLVSTPYNYWMSTRFVFDFKGSQNPRRLFVVFLILAAVGLGINELTMWVGDKLLSFDPLVVKLAGIVLAAVFNFITRKQILERKEQP
jgi:putative flippase GtrA